MQGYTRLKSFLSNLSTLQGLSSYCLIVQEVGKVTFYIFSNFGKAKYTLFQSQLIDQTGEYVVSTASLLSCLKLLNTEVTFTFLSGALKVRTDRFNFTLNVLFREDYPFQVWEEPRAHATSSELHHLLNSVKPIYSFTDRSDSFVSLSSNGRSMFAISPGSYYFAMMYVESDLEEVKLSLTKDQFNFISHWLKLHTECAYMVSDQSLVASYSNEWDGSAIVAQLYDLYESLDNYLALLHFQADFEVQVEDLKGMVNVGRAILTGTKRDCTWDLQGNVLQVSFYLPVTGESNFYFQVDNVDKVHIKGYVDFSVLQGMIQRITANSIGVKFYQEANALIFIDEDVRYLVAIQLA